MERELGPSPFRLFTRDSLFNIERRIAEEKAAKEAQKIAAEGSDESEDEVEEPSHNEPEPKPNPKLEAGRKLPPSLEDYATPDIIGRPVEDIDEYYHNKKTFCVIGKDKTIYRFSACDALFLLTPFNPIRRATLFILVHPMFSLFIMLTIIVNCVFMTNTNAPEDYVEYIFTGIYTVEAIVKITCRGFVMTPFTYLRDPWNWLDFFVINVAYITMALPFLGNLSALRTFRVLRALKTVAVIPGLKTIVGALLEAVRRLRDVMILTVFVLSIFALVGMQLYSGQLLNKCVRNWTMVLGPNVSDEEWEAYVNDSSNWQRLGDGEYQVCGNGSSAGQCMENYTCLKKLGVNPNHGYTSFDNFAWALLCAFRLMTQDFWESLYHLVLRAVGNVHALYFVLVILLGSFYLVNLILAIVAMSYDEQQRKDAEDAADEAAERLLEDERREMLSNMDNTSICEGLPDKVDEKDEVSVYSEQSASSFLQPNAKTQKRDSLSLPGSPFVYRRNSKASQFSWKKKPLRATDRQPLVHQNLENLPLPYADDSTAVTPSSDDLCNFPFYKNLPNGRRFSIASQTRRHRPDGKPPSRRSSFASNISRASRKSRKSATSPLDPLTKESKMERLFNFSRKGSQRVPDVVVDKPKKDDAAQETGSISSNASDSIVDKQPTKSQSNPFLYPSPTAANVDMKDVMVLKDLIDHASGHRRSFMSGTSGVQQPTMREKMFKYFCVWDCSPKFQVVQKYVCLFIMDAFVDLFITLCILVNTTFMAIDHWEMSKELRDMSDVANKLFTSIFAAEAFLKILALSPVNYFKDKWNVFDSIVVALSLMELALVQVQGLSVLRAFRLLRVFKLAKSWPILNMLISIVGRTMGALGNLTIVLAIVVFIFAVMGQQLFRPSYQLYNNHTLFPDSNGMPRWNFDDFLHSFMIVFRVLCGEWIESMWGCIIVAGYQCVPFFLLTMIIGNLVVLNLFLALLLSSFGAESFQRSQADDEPNKLAEAFSRFSRFGSWIKVKIIVCVKGKLQRKTKRPGGPIISPSSSRPELNGKDPMVDGQAVMGNGNVCDIVQTEEGGVLSVSTKTGPVKSQLDLTDGEKPVIRADSANSLCKDPKSPEESECSSSCSSLSDETKSNVKVEAEGEPEINEVEITYVKEPDECLCRICTKTCPWLYSLEKTEFFKYWWKFRCFMFKVTEHKYFETFIITMIISSSVALALEDIYLKERPILEAILKYLDKCFTGIFILEMIVKWVAFGLKTYFTDAWCWLDFIIVSLSLVMLAAESLNLGDVGAIKALRTLRALRPLRAVSRWEGMRVVVNALIKAVPSIFNVLLVCLVFWLIFGIMGVQLFSGKFHKCVYPENGTRVPHTIVNNKSDCDNMGYNWTNSKINFDNVLNAYLALFQVATYKGWIGIMNDAIDSRKAYEQPAHEVNRYMYLYFVLFIIFGSFFTLNLFIGVIIDNFNQQKKKAGGSLEMLMTDDQKKYYNAMKRMQSKAPQKSIPRPSFRIAAFIFDVTTDQKFDIVIMVVILLNMFTMTLEHEGMSQEWRDALSNINIVFIAIFTLECILKIVGLRLYYFKIAWNVFDFAVVILSVLALSLAGVMKNFFVSPTLLRVIRVFRVGRVLRLVKSAKGIRTLLFSLAVSLPALFNIGLLLALVMFIYAIMGMNFFRNAELEEGLDDAFNFRTFYQSFVILFQMCTSAGWDGVLAGLIYRCPPEGQCGEYMVAVMYLVSYLVISFLVVVNMYIAVILENFSQATEEVQQGLTPDDFDMYYEKWEKYDPDATEYIDLSQLSDFVDFLDEPLRLPKPNHFMLVKLDIPICEADKVHCKDILDALTKNFLGTTDTELPPEIKPGDKDKKIYPVVSSTLKRQKEHYAARIIQKAYRNYRANKSDDPNRNDDDGDDDGDSKECSRSNNSDTVVVVIEGDDADPNNTDQHKTIELHADSDVVA